MVNRTKRVQTKLMRGLLDLIVLQFLDGKPMHGYKVITRIRRSFGVYFGPSTIYPLLGKLEKDGYVECKWDMDSERPRKVYSLTTEGRKMLNFTEDSLNFICRKIGSSGVPKDISVRRDISESALHTFIKRVEGTKPI